MLQNIVEHFGDPLNPYQLIGWCGLIFYVISYQFKDPRQTIKCYLPADVAYAVHFYGLGSLSSMLIAIGAMFRNIVGVWGSDQMMKYAVIIYVIFAWCVTIFFLEDTYEIAAAIGTSFLSVSIWFRDRFYMNRLFVTCHQISWFVLYLFLGSYSGVVTMVVIFCSNMIGVMRYKSSVT